MGKKVQDSGDKEKVHKNTKAHRLDQVEEPVDSDKHTWPSNAVVYLGHLPHGFQEQQLKAYFTQYGDVLGVKLARSRITARSKGYGFVQFRYPQIAEIVRQTMNGYLLMGKVIVANTLSSSQKNPFFYSSSGKYRFINWKRIFIQQNRQPKSDYQTAHLIHNLIRKQQKRRQKFKELGIDYQFPGFSHLLPKQAGKKLKTKNQAKKNKSQ